MKKNILVFLCLCSTFTYAQKPVLKAGSLISIENKKEIRAKNVNVGDLVAFDVSEDIKVGDSIVISKGAKAYAKVLVAKKSGIAGTKGKLKVEWLYCVANNNTKVPLEGEIDFSYNGRKYNGTFKTEGSTDSIASDNTIYNIS